jgi:predicted type IV restriction endonuclease
MPRGSSTFRQRDVTAAIKAARKAGVEVARVEVTNGKFTLVLGEAEPTEASNPWLVELQRKAS